MKQTFRVSIKAWEKGSAIPSKFAFGKIPEKGNFELGGNVSPEVKWSGAPEGTLSYALICHDSDVPSIADDVNQEGKTIDADLPRTNFYHWVLANIPSEVRSLSEGVASSGVTPRGKVSGEKEYGLAGLNSYTQWFSGDSDMEGNYGDYDGPCPPWNDFIHHNYHFTVYALDIKSLELDEVFDADDVLKAMEGHVLAQDSWVGTYSMNRAVSGP